MGADHAGAGALLRPVADATDMMGVDEAHDADAVLPRPLDADVHRFLGHHLAIAVAAVDHDHRAVVLGDRGVMIAHTRTVLRVGDVGRHHAAPLAVIPQPIVHPHLLAHKFRLLPAPALP